MVEFIKKFLQDVQESFRGEAERMNLNSEEDVVSLVRQVRKELQEEHRKNFIDNNSPLL